MKKHIVTSMLYTMITAVLLGIVYPLTVTGLAHVLFPKQAEGSLIERNGVLVGSRLIGQPFDGPGYFWSRPSAAGAGYDASNSSGSNFAPTNAALIARVATTVKTLNPKGTGAAVPIDLATASASGLDPDISPAAAYYQAARVAAERHLSEDAVRKLVSSHITPRQFGLLGEPRVNVLELNLDLPLPGAEAAGRGARYSEAQLPGVVANDGDPGPEDGIGERHPGASAAFEARHDGQRVHAGTAGERPGDGRIGLRDADGRRRKPVF
jgi:K+-transporting ATPase ATPase C chain